MNENQRKGLELKGWHVIAGILGIVIVLFILFRVFGHSGLQRKIAQLRAKGYPTTFEELKKYNELPQGVPNAADLYLKAINAYQSPTALEKTLLPYVGSVVLEAGEPNSPEMQNAITSFLAANAETLDLLHQAGQIERCRFDYPAVGPPGFIIPNLSEIRECSKLLRLSILDKVFSGNTDQAVQEIKEHFRLGESLAPDPFLICHLVRVAIHAGGVDSVRMVLEKTTLSRQQMNELQSELIQFRDRLQMDHAFIGERLYFLDQEQMRQSLGFGTVPARFSGLMDINIIRTLEFYDQLEAVTKLPPQDRLKQYQQIEKDVEQLSVLYFVTKITLPALSKVGSIDLRVRAQLDSAITALSVERFRQAEGRLPESLEELVPRYMETVPIDPFDGKPLRYKRLEKGYTIYSIGDDGEDNGGIPKEKVKKGEKYDWPFTVER